MKYVMADYVNSLPAGSDMENVASVTPRGTGEFCT